MPDVQLVQTYGLTEGGGITTAMPDGEGWTCPDSVGRALPLTEIQIVSDDGAPVPPGAMGEVLVRSPSVSAGDWERPEESAQTFDRDWCRTGDLGTIASGGYLTITGRKKDMIKSGGENIYPMEIEAVLGSIRMCRRRRSSVCLTRNTLRPCALWLSREEVLRLPRRRSLSTAVRTWPVTRSPDM